MELLETLAPTASVLQTAATEFVGQCYRSSLAAPEPAEGAEFRQRLLIQMRERSYSYCLVIAAVISRLAQKGDSLSGCVDTPHA
jgi:hypothetical protein